MKHVVLMNDLRGEDIRPPVLFSKFRELSLEDARRFLSDPEAMTEVDCPACGSARKSRAFDRDGFIYNLCNECRSVYVSPRPRPEALDPYYAHSRASKFRAEHYSRQTAEARRRLILRSNANWLGRLYDEAGNAEARGYADLGTNFPLVFDEIRELGLFSEFFSIDPIPDFDPLIREHGAEVVRGARTGLGAVTAFEQLEHEFSPEQYLRAAHEMLAPGGMIFFTTKTISGFDLQTLWGEAAYIFAPEHLNLLSIEGLAELVRRAGFELIELSTPGQLDLELVAATMKENPAAQVPRFVSYLIEERDAEARRDFQEFLQKHRLSSHARAAAVKRPT